jgi:two-component system sensor histidine kinase KdpD
MNKKIIYLLNFSLTLVLTIILTLLLNHIGIRKENTLLVYIISVLLIATFTEGYVYGIVASFITAMSYNYFFTLPYYDFHMSDSNDIMLVIFFLLTSFIACNLTVKFQKQLIISRKNERITKQLYLLSEKLLNVSGIDNILRLGQNYIKETIGINSIISLDIIENNPFPLISKNRVIGSIQLNIDRQLTDEEEIIIKSSANQIANTLDKELTYIEQEKIKVAMEKEHMLNSMLKSISHDLRTPLTGIVGASQLISEKSDDENIRLLAKDIDFQSKWLTQIVENILNMSKIDSGNLVIQKNIEAVDDLIQGAIHLTNGLEDRDVHIHLPDQLLFVNVDGKLILQVLVNLLNNAVKYTNKNDSIDIIVKEESEFVKFIIKDSGQGIDSSIQNNLFNEFVTYPGVSEDSKKGIGLGLAICKAVIEAHNGYIYAVNNKDKGASFIFGLKKEGGLDFDE